MKKLLIFVIILLGLGYAGYRYSSVPGGFEPGTALPGYSEKELAAALKLESRVRRLSSLIGERNYAKPEALNDAAQTIAAWFMELGYAPEITSYEYDGVTYLNVGARVAASRAGGQVFVIGAHYDSPKGSPGADNGASGVAALLQLAEELRGVNLNREVRLVAFVNALGPFHISGQMGSFHYASGLKSAGIKVGGMLSLDSLGCFSKSRELRGGPGWFRFMLPSSQDFLLFLGNLESRRLAKACLERFDLEGNFPVQALSLPWFLPGVSSGDEWSFWSHGYAAVAVTDLGSLRSPEVSGPRDFTENLDYPRLARVSLGLSKLVRQFANSSY